MATKMKARAPTRAEGNGSAPPRSGRGSTPLKVRWHRVIAESQLPRHLKHTALALETNMNPDGFGWGRRETFAGYADMSERALSRNAHKLHVLGYIEWQPGSGRGHASEVQAVIPSVKGDTGVSLSEEERGTWASRKGDTGGLKGDTGVSSRDKAKGSKGSVAASLTLDSGETESLGQPDPGERSCGNCGVMLEAYRVEWPEDWAWYCEKDGWFRRSSEEEEEVDSAAV